MLFIVLFCLVASTIALPLAEETTVPAVTESVTTVSIVTESKPDSNEKVEDVTGTVPDLATSEKPTSAEENNKTSKEDEDDKNIDSKETDRNESTNSNESANVSEKPSLVSFDINNPFITPFFSSVLSHQNFNPFFGHPFPFFNTFSKTNYPPYFIILTD